nr:hypothetical protein [Tanacetum cinerariifolium]
MQVQTIVHNSMADMRSNGLKRQPVTLAKDIEVLKDSGMDSNVLMNKEQDNPDPFSYDTINSVQAWLIDLSSILLAERLMNKEQDNPDPFSYDTINSVQAWLIDLSSILLAERWSLPMVVVVPHLLEIVIAVAVVGGMVVFLNALITEFGDWVTVFCIVARPQVSMF